MTTKSCNIIDGYEVNVYSTGRAKLSDSLLYGFALKDVPTENINEELKKLVPSNETLVEMISDIESHKCTCPKIIKDDFKEKMQIGFKCEGCQTKWRVSLPELKSCIVYHPELKELFRESESRDIFAEQLTKRIISSQLNKGIS